MSDQDEGFGPALRGGGRSPVVERAPRASREDDGDDHGFGPPARGRVRGGRRWLRTLAIILLVLVLLVVGVGGALAVSALSKISRVPVDGLEAVDGRMNVLLVGSDSREGLNKSQRRRLGTGTAEGGRSDTILLLTIEAGRAAMLSFPRDLFVTRCDGSQGRINAAYGLGGPSCLVETVSRLSGVPITNYMEVSFLGFADIVDAVGGVRMFVEQPISDADAHVDLEAGCQVLDGREALGFVRVRKIDSDLGRVARQQRFIKELAKEVARPSTVLNVPRLFSTVNAAARALTADEGLGPLDLFRLARGAVGIGSGKLASFTVPAVPGSVGGASLLIPDDEQAEALFAAFRSGSVLAQASGEVKPADVELEVRNGTNIAGLAGRAGEILTDAGFEVTGIGNAPRVEHTVVRYTEGNEDKARLVADSVPGGAEIQQVDSGPPVVLVLGRDIDLSHDVPERVPNLRFADRGTDRRAPYLRFADRGTDRRAPYLRFADRGTELDGVALVAEFTGTDEGPADC